MKRLLDQGEPPPVAIENAGGGSPVVLLCEHAGRRIPRALGALGLADEHLSKHFMWDIGALDVAQRLSRALDAPMVHQRYSRMVCDCNRPTHAGSYIPSEGEGIPVPGNVGLTDADRDARTEAIWSPFHAEVAQILDDRAGRPTALVTIHTFTPVFFGVRRDFAAGILFARDPAFAPALVGELAARVEGGVRANEPYTVDRDSDVAIPVHGEDRGLPCALVEIRNDLVYDAQGAARWASHLANAIRAALPAAGITQKESR